jgi:formylmethanofuran dehydrogenase subunit C
MALSEEQNATICSWVESGKSISEIQKLLKEQFSLSYTYMEVRFLVDDLGAVYIEPESNKEEEIESEETDIEASSANENKTDGSVVVDVDAVIRPGSLVSGTVTFSDGETLGWQLTSAGQLGLIPGDNPEYRPSNEDVQSFQSQLQTILQQKGF